MITALLVLIAFLTYMCARTLRTVTLNQKALSIQLGAIIKELRK